MKENVVWPDEELVPALLKGENEQAWSFTPAVVELPGCPTVAGAVSVGGTVSSCRY